MIPDSSETLECFTMWTWELQTETDGTQCLRVTISPETPLTEAARELLACSERLVLLAVDRQDTDRVVKLAGLLRKRRRLGREQGFILQKLSLREAGWSLRAEQCPTQVIDDGQVTLGYPSHSFKAS